MQLFGTEPCSGPDQAEPVKPGFVQSAVSDGGVNQNPGSDGRRWYGAVKLMR